MSASGVLADEAFGRLVLTENGSFWFRSRNRVLCWALERYFPQASSLLEVGCGNGYVLAGIGARRKELSLTGSDLSDTALRHAAARLPQGRFIKADVRALPFEEEFDAIGAFDVIEHVAEDAIALQSIRRSLRAGGGLLVTVPQHRWLWSETDRYSGHQRRYTRGLLVRRLHAAGFRVRYTTSFVTLLLPALLASRGWQAISRKPFDPGRELTLPPTVDRLFEGVMNLEARMLMAGARFPVGGSLLAVAERR